MSGNGDGMVGILALGLLAYWLWPGSSEYVTIYQRVCVQARAVGPDHFMTYYDCSRLQDSTTYVTSRTFRVNYEKQQVFSLGLLGAVRYESCSVGDNLNWNCDEPVHPGARIIMTDGQFSDWSGFPNDQVNWVSYWALKLASWVK